MKKLLGLFFILLILACTPKQRYPRLMSAEQQMVQDCQYLDTLSEISDPGRLLPKYRENDAEQRVMWRADRLGATHVVWLYNYQRIGSAASAYRCGQ